MKSVLKYYWTPGIFGMISCVLLIISRWLSSSDSSLLQAVNNVLTVAVLAVCIHMVRRTASLRGFHIWNDKKLTVVFTVPVVLLVLTVLQFMLKENSVFQLLMAGDVAKVILISLSFPLFFLYYFLYLSDHDKKRLRVGRSLFSVLCSVYAVMRLLSAVLLPLLQNGGIAVPAWLITVCAANTYISLAIYVISFFAFLYMTKAFYKNTGITKPQANGDETP